MDKLATKLNNTADVGVAMDKRFGPSSEPKRSKKSLFAAITSKLQSLLPK